MPELSSAYLPESTPWIELCTQLTRLVTASLRDEPALVSITVTGWLKGRGRLVERAVKLGCVKTDRVNLINVQSKCGTKVTVTAVEGCGDVVSVESSGREVSGRVLGNKIVLTHVAGKSVGMVELSGCVLVTKGTSLTEIIQQLQDITEVGRGVCWTVNLKSTVSCSIKFSDLE